jgi:transmembrane sensor
VNTHSHTVADEQASLWAARLEGGTLSASDRGALDQWLAENPSHRSLLSSYCQFSADLEQQLPLLEGIKEGSEERRTRAPATALLLPWLRRSMLAGVALTAAAAVVYFAARPATPVEVNLTSPIGGRQQHTLADGTRMELNARTAVAVTMDAQERRVRLASGQAYFDVSKDASRPFIVETPAGAVRVTGTAFDLRADDETLSVVVAEGTVQVRPRRSPGGAGAPVSLNAGDSLVANATGVNVETLDAKRLSARLAWRDGYAVFIGARLDAALAEFARFHGRGITATEEVAHLRVGGRYPLNDLSGFLVSLEDILQVRATRDLNGAILVEAR